MIFPDLSNVQVIIRSALPGGCGLGQIPSVWPEIGEAAT